MKIAITFERYVGNGYKATPSAMNWKTQLARAQRRVFPDLELGDQGFLAVVGADSQKFLDDLCPGRSQKDLAEGMRVNRTVDLELFLKWAGEEVRDEFKNPTPAPAPEED